jgi:hypothetical protein
VPAVEIDLVDADDADGVLLAGGILICNGGAEKHAPGRRA